MKLVSIITATTGNPLLEKCIESVRNQTYENIQHIILIDGYDRFEKVNPILTKNDFPRQDPMKEVVVQLPYSIGKDRWNGHRIYAAASYIAEGDYFIYLDDDNGLDPTHVQDCIDVINKGYDWSYSFRKVVDKEGTVLCNDDCESLGKWASVMHPEDYFVDVNCYFLPKNLAVHITPVWYRKFREPGQMEVDRALCHVLRKIAPNYDSTYKYTANYTVGNSSMSVTADFFLQGNAEMLRRYNNTLPWRQ